MMALAPLTVQCMPARLSRVPTTILRSEEHTSELQSRLHLVCRLLLEKKNAFITTERRTTRWSCLCTTFDMFAPPEVAHEASEHNSLVTCIVRTIVRPLV